MAAILVELVAALKEGAREEFAKQMERLGQEGGAAATKGIDQGSGGLEQLWGKIKSGFGAVAGAIGVAFSAKAVFDFARGAIAEAENVRRSWADTARVVENSGKNFEGMRSEIERVTDDIADRFAFDDTEIRDGFNKLTQMTGNAAGSLKNMDVVAAVAKQGQMGVAQAAELVGRALETGNTKGLVPFIGGIKDGIPIMQALREKMEGVEETISPLEKAQARFGRNWDSIRASVGNALIQIANSSGILDGLSGMLQKVADWVGQNQDKISAWAEEVSEILVWLAENGYKKVFLPLVDAVEDLWTALKKQQGWTSLSDAIRRTKLDFREFQAYVTIIGAWFNRLAFTMGKSFVEMVLNINKAVLWVAEAAEKAFRAVGWDTWANAMGNLAAQTRRDIGGLQDFVNKQNHAIALSYGETAKAKVELTNVHNEREALATRTTVEETGKRDKADKDSNENSLKRWTKWGKTVGGTNGDGVFGRVAGRGKESATLIEKAMKAAAEKAEKAFIDFVVNTSESLATAVKMAQEAGEAIALGLSGAKGVDAAIQASYKKQLDDLKKRIGERNLAEDEARKARLQAEERALAKELEAAGTTAERRREIMERQTAIAAELAAIRAREELQAGDDYAKTWEAATDRVKEAEWDSGRVHTEVEGDKVEASDAASQTFADKWIEKLKLIGGQLSALGGIFGGFFAKIAEGLTSVLGGFEQLEAGMKALSEVTAKGLEGMTEKIGAFAAAVGGGMAIGGAVGGKTGSILGGAGAGIAVLAGASGPVAGLVALGAGIVGGMFHKNKDPGRLKGNDDAYAKARTGDAGALEFLRAHSPTRLGGDGQWATTKAQEDAFGKYWDVLLTQAVAGDGDALERLQQLMPLVSSYGSAGSAGRTWAERLLTNGRPIVAALSKPESTGTPVSRAPAARPTVTAPPLATSATGGRTLSELLGAVGGAVTAGDALSRIGTIGTAAPLAAIRYGATGEQFAAPTFNAPVDNSRTLSVSIALTGVADRDVPQRIVDAIKVQLARDYQQQAALAGNVALP